MGHWKKKASQSKFKFKLFPLTLGVPDGVTGNQHYYKKGFRTLQENGYLLHQDYMPAYTEFKVNLFF